MSEGKGSNSLSLVIPKEVEKLGIGRPPTRFSSAAHEEIDHPSQTGKHLHATYYSTMSRVLKTFDTSRSIAMRASCSGVFSSTSTTGGSLRGANLLHHQRVTLHRGIERNLVIEPHQSPIPRPLVSVSDHGAWHHAFEGEGVDTDLRLRLRTFIIASAHEHGLRLEVAAEDTCEPLGAWCQSARLCQPHVEVETEERSRCHLVQEDTEELEHHHNSRVEGESKASGDEVAEGDPFVQI